MTKIFITTSATLNETHSVEAGVHDGTNHFDHHPPFQGERSPANNPEISKIPQDSVIRVSHMDADTFVGILRMLGSELPDVDLDLLEKIDLNGSSVCEDQFDPTLLYIVGISELCQKVGISYATSEHVDITENVMKMMEKNAEEIIEIGRLAKEITEKTHVDCLVERTSKVGLWSVDEENPIDASRPYADGIDVTVVYQKQYKSISLYFNPKSDLSAPLLSDKDENPIERQQGFFAGIRFQGHAKACGSERTDNGYTEKDAVRVFKALT